MTDTMNTQSVPRTTDNSTETVAAIAEIETKIEALDIDEKIETHDPLTQESEQESEQEDPDQEDPNQSNLDPDVDSELEVEENDEAHPLEDPEYDDEPQKLSDEQELSATALGSQENPIEAKEPSVFTWNGKRPFAGAVAQYEVVLADAISAAEQQLLENPKHAYAKVILPLFTTLWVECADQYGNTKVKKFAFHEAHYGPHISTKKSNLNKKSAVEQKWAGFLNRYVYIWTCLGQEGKAPGGDGTGRGNTACSPFRNAQLAELAKGLYLIDGSDVAHDEQSGNAWYNINIALYRYPPRDGPFRAAHGYGFIPYLGPARVPVVQQTVAVDVQPESVPVDEHTDPQN